MTLDEILQLAEEFEKQAASEDVKKLPHSPEHNAEVSRKQAEVKEFCAQIKRLSDQIDIKYKETGKAAGIFKLYDVNYHSTINALKRNKESLEDILKGLSKSFF